MHAQTHSYVPGPGNGQDFYTLHNNLAQASDKVATQYMYKWPCLIKPLIIQLPRNKSLEYGGKKKQKKKHEKQNVQADLLLFLQETPLSLMPLPGQCNHSMAA